VSGAAAALALAQEAGVRLRVDEGRLKVVGRPEAVPAEVLATLREHKAEVLELLQAGSRGQAANDDGDAPEPAGTALDSDGYPYRPCPTCRGRLFGKPADLPDAGPGWRCRSCEPPDGPYHACALPPDPDHPAQDGSRQGRRGTRRARRGAAHR
jgi:hypothetical protein